MLDKKKFGEELINTINDLYDRWCKADECLKKMELMTQLVGGVQNKAIMDQMKVMNRLADQLKEEKRKILTALNQTNALVSTDQLFETKEEFNKALKEKVSIVNNLLQTIKDNGYEDDLTVIPSADHQLSMLKRINEAANQVDCLPPFGQGFYFSILDGIETEFKSIIKANEQLKKL